MSISGLRTEQFKVKLFDDFLGKSFSTDDWWDTKLGSAPPPAVALTTNLSGLLRLQTGNAAGATMAVNGVQVHSNLNWQANRSGLSMECKLATQGGITTVAIFVGFTNQVAALDIPFALAAGDTLSTTAANAVGFLFDTAADTDNWWAVGVSATVLATKQNLAVAPVLSTYETLRVDVSRTGVAAFRRNGATIGTAMTGSVGAAIPLTPVVAIFSRAATTRFVDIDYLYCEQNR